MLQVGVIGYGQRIAGLVQQMRRFDIPFEISAICDPRLQAIQAKNDPQLTATRFYSEAREMLVHEQLNGVMIGTRCPEHTPMACLVAEYGYAIFLEKPVAVNFEQLKLLRDQFANRNVPVLVSFPLRLTPIVQRVKEIVAADQIGTIEHIIAVNDVPYGAVYFNDWYRDYDIVGGLFLQKATHDFDYLADLVGQRVSWVGAMNSRRVYGGHQPYDLKCKDCQLQKTCLESPFNLYYQRYEGKAVQQTDWRTCVWSQGLKNEDVGNCLLEYANGVQASYTQNFFARNQAARRGARLYGYKGTIDFDWYRDEINIYYHQSPRVETIKFTGAIGHFGGDHELCHDWLGMLRGEMSSRAPLQAGIESVLTCLWARESAEKRIFCEVKWP